MEEEYLKGNDCVRNGDYELAVACYQKSLHLSTSSSHEDALLVKLHLNLSHCHLKLRNFEVQILLRFDLTHKSGHSLLEIIALNVFDWILGTSRPSSVGL
jgi:hypothetical protein